MDEKKDVKQEEMDDKKGKSIKEASDECFAEDELNTRDADEAADSWGQDEEEKEEDKTSEDDAPKAEDEAKETSSDVPGQKDGEKADDDGKAKEDAASDSSKSGFFKKKEKKDKKDEQIEELTDRVRRQMAEFDNFRKRTEREKTQMFETGARSIIEKLLPVVDNFERGLASIPEEEKGSAVCEGMEKIYKQLTAMLEDAGVTVIEAVGKEFDPNLHNAVMHEENDELGENMVSQEFQKGYMYRDTVVRHSMVKVAN